MKTGVGAEVHGPVHLARGALAAAGAAAARAALPHAVAVGFQLRKEREGSVREEAADDPEVASVTNEFPR